MNLLLDTHTFVWWDNARLPASVTKRIQRADAVFLSVVVGWEIAIKSSVGKMTAKGRVADAIADYGFTPLPIHLSHANAVRSLPPLHREPFDRMRIAPPLGEDFVVVSAAEALRA